MKGEWIILTTNSARLRASSAGFRGIITKIVAPIRYHIRAITGSCPIFVVNPAGIVAAFCRL